MGGTQLQSHHGDTGLDKIKNAQAKETGKNQPANCQLKRDAAMDLLVDLWNKYHTNEGFKAWHHNTKDVKKNVVGLARYELRESKLYINKVLHTAELRETYLRPGEYVLQTLPKYDKNNPKVFGPLAPLTFTVEVDKGLTDHEMKVTQTSDQPPFETDCFITVNKRQPCKFSGRDRTAPERDMPDAGELAPSHPDNYPKARAVYGEALYPSDYQDAAYVGGVPSYGYSAPAIGGYGYNSSSATSIDALAMVLLFVLIPMLCCVICAITNAVVGAACFVVGRKSATKDEPETELELDV